LNLSNPATDVPVVSQDNSWINIYSYNGILKAEINLPDLHSGTLKIFNLTGEALFIYKIYQPGYYEFTPNLKAGIYVVNFTNSTSRYSKKIFFQ
jgi:hypothetical protein